MEKSGLDKFFKNKRGKDEKKQEKENINTLKAEKKAKKEQERNIDFFVQHAEDNKKNHEKVNVPIKNTKKQHLDYLEDLEDEEEEEDGEGTTISIRGCRIKNAPSNLSPSYLIDVKYDGDSSKAYLKLYNPEDNTIYRFYDKSNHKPYFITTQEPDKVNSALSYRKDYIGSELVKKHDMLGDKDLNLTKVFGSNPLAIGGRNNSFREKIKPAYEANIRYHLNYIYDQSLVPNLLYKIEDGELIQVTPKIDKNVKESIQSIFKDQSNEVKKLVDEYLPTFFSDIPRMPRCAVDIEVESEKGKIPNPATADKKVTSVGFSDTNGLTSVYVLNEKKQSVKVNDTSIVIKQFESEKDLIEATIEKILQYPIILTFNGDNFDFPYLDNRAKKLGIKEEKIPFIQTHSATNDTYLEYGIHIDLYRFFRQPAMRIYAFGAKYDRVTLDELGISLLGKEKLKFDEDIWDLDINDLIIYNARDAIITLELTTFNNNQAMEIIYMLSRITKMPIDDFIRSSVSIWIQSWLFYEHRQRNYLIPRKQDILYAKGEASTQAMIKGKKYQGAIVIEPQAGVWWDVHVLDFASLYPSIIKTRNLSYETINCEHDVCRKTNKIPETRHWVCIKREGISSMLVGFIRDMRVYWFKQKAKDNSITESARQLSNVIQSSLKVLINACYGVFGSNNFSLYCPPVAESTAALAREAISKTKKYCEETLDIPVLYGDTDSIFVHKPTQEDIKKLEEWSLNTFQIELGTDYAFRYCGLSDRKKNYFGITKLGNPIVKGLMGKKKNTPTIVKRAFNEILNILTSVKNEKELAIAKKKSIKVVRRTIKQVEKRSFDLEDLTISVTLSKKLNEYDSWTQPLQAAVQLIIDENITKKPTVGSTITYIKTRPFKINPPNQILSDKLSGSNECSVKPIELARKRDVDIDKMKELVQSTFVQLLDTIGISWNEVQGISALDTYFN